MPDGSEALGLEMCIQPAKIRLAPAIAWSLPNAMWRGKWFMPQELVMRVCSGGSQLCLLIRSATVSADSTLKS